MLFEHLTFELKKKHTHNSIMALEPARMKHTEHHSVEGVSVPNRSRENKRESDRDKNLKKNELNKKKKPQQIKCVYKTEKCAYMQCEWYVYSRHTKQSTRSPNSLNYIVFFFCSVL